MNLVNKLLTKKELCREILNMDVKTAEKQILYQDGFPFIRVGKRKLYPLKEVNEWISERTEYA